MLCHFTHSYEFHFLMESDMEPREKKWKQERISSSQALTVNNQIAINWQTAISEILNKARRQATFAWAAAKQRGWSRFTVTAIHFYKSLQCHLKAFHWNPVKLRTCIQTHWTQHAPDITNTQHTNKMSSDKHLRNWQESRWNMMTVLKRVGSESLWIFWHSFYTSQTKSNKAWSLSLHTRSEPVLAAQAYY